LLLFVIIFIDNVRKGRGQMEVLGNWIQNGVIFT